MLYADARGVCRVYETTMDDELWSITRAAPQGFHQRLVARVQPDRIAGAWERWRTGRTGRTTSN